MLTFHDLDQKKHITVFDLEPGSNPGKQFHVAMKICENPFCGCKTVSLSNFTWVSENPGIYKYDLEKHRFEKHSATAADREWIFGVESMDQADRDSLMSRFMGMKQKIIEKADWTGFPKPVLPHIRERDAMVGFHEVFPLASELIFERKESGGRYLVDEQYCVDPDCNCNHVALTFILLPGRNGEPETLASLLVGYRTGEIEEELFVSSGVAGPGTLVGWLTEAVPDVLRQFSGRHRKMKEVFRDNPSFVCPDIPAPEKIGRNDLCPCGSGKKYKKCCLRK